MDIPEAQRRKREAEAQILTIIRTFEKDVGVTVDSNVWIEQVRTMGRPVGAVAVRLTVTL